MKRSRWTRFILLFILIGPIAILVFGGIVMLLWNNALAPVLHISTVTFWQALGILVLSKILFSSFSGGAGRRYPSWKERISQKWKDRWWKGGYKPWDSETGVEQPGAGS